MTKCEDCKHYEVDSGDYPCENCTRPEFRRDYFEPKQPVVEHDCLNCSIGLDAEECPVTIYKMEGQFDKCKQYEPLNEPKQQQEEKYPSFPYCEWKKGYCSKQPQKQLDVDGIEHNIGHIEWVATHNKEALQCVREWVQEIRKKLKGEDDG